ncbi:hypothetical protein JCM3766R1_007058 [Sporobolomyces carnicolor]
MRIRTSLGLLSSSKNATQGRRGFCTSRAVESPNIYVSDSNDPHFNLAFEDWLFRKTDPSERILYLYRNVPSVIIGRNQNPWKEINLARLDELGIPFVRRKSGGGTVYHDLGNTNYCVFVPRLEFNRNTNAELVASALNRLDVPAFVNERNDICVEQFKMSSLSPSRSLCSAFKLVNHRAYHHGTMLIDAQLSNLRGVLGTKKEGMITKGVASVPSPVRNLKEWNADLDHERFVEQVSQEFARRYNVSDEVQRIGKQEIERNEYVRNTVDELKSWEWQYGNSPEFTHDLTGNDMTISLRSRHGLITSASVSTPPDDADLWSAASEVCEVLEGDRYGTIEQTREYLARASPGTYKELLTRIMAEQVEKSFQKQPLFHNAKVSTTSRKVAGKDRRWFKEVGLGFKTPREAIEGTYIDKKCPFTGLVSIRGRILTGKVVSTKMTRTIVIRREYLHFVPKYSRYEKRHKNVAVHCSPAFRVEVGDVVTVGQCRPLSKTVRFNVLRVQKAKAKNFIKF